jgi:sigma-B regulation protein RsbU (phosphoserine phosphatase)
LRITSVLGISFFGESPAHDGIVGKTIIEHFQGDDPNYPLVAAHRLALQGRSISSDVPWGERVFHTHVEPLRDPIGRIIGTLGVALDVTDSTRLRSEMVLARRIQEMFWRSALIHIPSWDVAGASYPAESTSGDYFDFIRTAGGKVIIAMGDVSGHGVGPALLGVSLRGHVRAWSQVDNDIVGLLTRANLMVCAEAPEDRFITCMLALFDPQTGKFTYANAGHPAGYVLDAHGKVRCRLSNTCSAPLGIDESARFASGGEITLAPGELALWISDGALDAFDLTESRFGEDRLLQSIRLFRNDSARQIIYNLYHTIRAYAHEKQDDDISAIVVKAAESHR